MCSVSVIIPASDEEAHIRDAIESALSQTQPPLEVIVVDDGSTDRTRDLASAFGDSVVVLSQSSQGSGAARNLGATRARGDWLAFLDADDVWLPSKLERQLASLPRDAVISCTDRYNVGELDGLSMIQSDVSPLADGDVFEYQLLHGNFITTSSVILRRAVFEEVGGFSTEPDLVVGQDWDLWMRVLERHRLSVCREPLVKYRLHVGSASRRLHLMIRARRRVVERALASARGRTVPPRIRRKAWASLHRTNGWDAARTAEWRWAAACYARAIAAHPWDLAAYKGLMKVVVRRS